MNELSDRNIDEIIIWRNIMKKVYKLLFLTIILNVADSIFYMNMLWYITDNLDNSYYLGIFFL